MIYISKYISIDPEGASDPEGAFARIRFQDEPVVVTPEILPDLLLRLGATPEWVEIMRGMYLS